MCGLCLFGCACPHGASAGCSHQICARLPQADLWSVGTILFELITGRPPFSGNNHVHLLRNIERSEARLPEAIRETLSPAAVHIISQASQQGLRMSICTAALSPLCSLDHAQVCCHARCHLTGWLHAPTANCSQKNHSTSTILGPSQDKHSCALLLEWRCACSC